MARESEPTERESFGDLVGRTPAMRALFEEGAHLAQTQGSIVLLGEAGTGKDLIARAIHRESPRRAGPFIVVDCGAMSSEVLEAELFGRAEGATRGRAGALELCRGGTLLLDEVADLPLDLQPRLQEALATHRFTRVGGRELLPLDVRIVAASRRKLAPEVARGKFQPELYAQLAESELTLPPLRERREDLPLLCQVLLARLAEGEPVTLSPEALEALALHDWPGNVRELRNVLERFLYALRAGGAGARRLGGALLSGELPAVERRSSPMPESSIFEPGISYREERARFEAAFERRYVSWLLEQHDGNISAAARAAEMDRKYLYKLARKHGLKPAS